MQLLLSVILTISGYRIVHSFSSHKLHEAFAAKNLRRYARDTDNELSTYIDNTSKPTGYYTDTPSTTAPSSKSKNAPKWLLYVSAVPTILVFIICVIIIAIKNYYEEDDEMDIKTTQPDGLLALATSDAMKKMSKSKKKTKNKEVYDVMLAKFKADKNKKRSFVGRRSSQIRIEGMVSRSPKSLARKHIIIGKLNQEDLTPDGESSALGQLVQLSTHTFIGSTLIEQMEESEWENDKTHIRSILERSKEDLSEARKILPDDVNEALLPEDLEEAFRNFGNWEESLI
ncbi:uncharacterized protein LOC130658002 [Hydractinia symbiolongicarpus]|uniref:uncharacterized protein LOC130658002 n=1 Tax=Hydractinia symbiolongicarpus TaxID=13093 RepID=UPI0025507DDD|nr:uncharacterized protein LOC130658002 [Hydractinia symbiolongicarpus]